MVEVNAIGCKPWMRRKVLLHWLVNIQNQVNPRGVLVEKQKMVVNDSCNTYNFDTNGIASDGCEDGCVATNGICSTCTTALATGCTTVASCNTNKFDTNGIASAFLPSSNSSALSSRGMGSISAAAAALEEEDTPEEDEEDDNAAVALDSSFAAEACVAILCASICVCTFLAARVTALASAAF